MSEQTTTAPTQHGPETVCYTNGPLGTLPYLQCMCGWDTVQRSWEMVSLKFDEHLALGY